MSVAEAVADLRQGAMESPMAGYLSGSEAALALGIKPSTVRAQIGKGKLRSRVAGGNHYIALDEVERYQRENQSKKARYRRSAASPGLQRLGEVFCVEPSLASIHRRLRQMSGHATGNEVDARRFLHEALRTYSELDAPTSSEPTLALAQEIQELFVRLAKLWPDPLVDVGQQQIDGSMFEENG